MKFDLGHINKIAAVSLKYEGDKLLFHYSILRFKKGEVEILKSEKRIASIKELIKKISNKIPIVLHLEGKGILNRLVDRVDNYRHALLMNARLDDFYFTDCLEENKVYSSVIRRDVVAKFLEDFEESNVEVVSFGTGPFVAAPLLSSIRKSEMTIDKVQIIFSEECIDSFEKNEDFDRPTELDGDLIDHEMLGALSLGLNFFFKFDSLVLAEEEQVFEQNYLAAKQKNVFYRFAVGMVMFFLLLLCGNYFYLEHLNNKIEVNYLNLAEFEDQLAEIGNLEDEKNRKEKLLSGSGLLSKNFLSYYLMEVSNSAPSGVTLNELIVRPLRDEIKGRHKIEFHDQLVFIHGMAKSSTVLSEWIEDLEGTTWLSSVDILDYTYKKNVGNFELELRLN